MIQISKDRKNFKQNKKNREIHLSIELFVTRMEKFSKKKNKDTSHLSCKYLL